MFKWKVYKRNMFRSKHSLDLFSKLAARMGAYNHGVLIFMGANKYSKLCLDLNCVSHYVNQSYYQASIQLFSLQTVKKLDGDLKEDYVNTTSSSNY